MRRLFIWWHNSSLPRSLPNQFVWFAFLVCGGGFDCVAVEIDDVDIFSCSSGSSKLFALPQSPYLWVLHSPCIWVGWRSVSFINSTSVARTSLRNLHENAPILKPFANHHIFSENFRVLLLSVSSLYSLIADSLYNYIHFSMNSSLNAHWVRVQN